MDDIPQWAGYMCACIAGVCFGSNFVPVKRYHNQVGDGLFFQWVLCSAIFFCGFIVYVTRGYPTFEPLAILGGFLWCTGNVMTVPIIKCIGLSLGMLLWGLFNLLMGWCSGSFGWFGLKTEHVSIVWLSYLGAAMAALSGVFFSQIRSNAPDPKQIQEAEPYGESLKSTYDYNEGDIIDNLSPLRKKVLGVFMSIVAGILYGTNFNPPQYLIDNCDTCSKESLDYVFPHFCGIYLTSTFYFLCYCLVKKNVPHVPTELAFPAFLSGLMWALADISWFIANSALELVISYPIITIMPGIVASIWGIVVFHEIEGKRNFIFFGLGFLLSFISAACTVISNKGL
jgi:glucose uptake protein GlcU